MRSGICGHVRILYCGSALTSGRRKPRQRAPGPNSSARSASSGGRTGLKILWRCALRVGSTSTPSTLDSRSATGGRGVLRQQREPKRLKRSRSSIRAMPARSSSTPGDTSFGSPGRRTHRRPWWDLLHTGGRSVATSEVPAFFKAKVRSVSHLQMSSSRGLCLRAFSVFI